MGSVTQGLRKLGSKGGESGDKVVACIYWELRKIAQNLMVKENPGHTLQATALANEGWIRLKKELENYNWKNRDQFYSRAKVTMDRVLVDAARKRHTHSRNTGIQTEAFDENQVADLRQGSMEGDVAAAIAKVREIKPEAATVLEARVLLKMTYGEIAAHLGQELGVKDPKSLRKLFDLGRILFARQLGLDPVSVADEG